MKKLFFVVALAATTLTAVAADKPIKVATLGETSMANRSETGTDERGWGQVLPTYFNDLTSFQNLADENISVHKLVQSEQYKDLINQLDKGTVLLIQFGDNDLIQEDATLFSNIEMFQQELQKLVKFAQKKCKVILVTPIARNHFSLEDEAAVERHGLYAEAVRRVAKANNVPLIDLNDQTFKWVRRLGKEGVAEYYTTADLKDADQRLTEKGALEVARMAAETIKTQKLKPLNKYVINSEPAVRYAK